MAHLFFKSDYPFSKIKRDILVLCVSFGVTLFLVKSGIIDSLFIVLGTWGLIGVFIVGVGFSSVFFAVPATAIIFIFAQHMPYWLIAFIAASGSMVGDYIVLRFLRHGIVEDVAILIEQRSLSRRWPIIFRSRLLYWLTSFVAAVIIASPLPDEIGLMLLAAIRFDVKRFLPIAFVLNFFGILVITLLAQVH